MNGYRKAIEGREHEYPLLARAIDNLQPAQNVKIEWPGGWNYQQIVRWPFGITDRELVRHGIPEGALNEHPALVAHKDEFLTKVLESIERILWDGVRDLPRTFTRTCGGARELLGRDPIDTDRIALRPLRDLEFRTWEKDNGTVVGEWIAEFSLEAVAGAPVPA